MEKCGIIEVGIEDICKKPFLAVRRLFCGIIKLTADWGVPSRMRSERVQSSLRPILGNVGAPDGGVEKRSSRLPHEEKVAGSNPAPTTKTLYLPKKLSPEKRAQRVFSWYNDYVKLICHAAVFAGAVWLKVNSLGFFVYIFFKMYTFSLNMYTPYSTFRRKKVE